MVFEFEFINYFPFDRPYEKYMQNLLEYDILENRENIDKLFLVIKIVYKSSFCKIFKIFFEKI